MFALLLCMYHLLLHFSPWPVSRILGGGGARHLSACLGLGWTDGACTGYLEAGATKHVHGTAVMLESGRFASNRALSRETAG